MNREVEFGKKLNELRKLGAEQGQCVSEEQLQELFRELELDESQFALIRDYLKTHNIGIGEPADPADYLGNEELDYLKFYLEELEELPKYSQEEQDAFILRAIRGDKSRDGEIVQIFLPQVLEIAKLYAGQGVFLEDLVGEGNLALMKAVAMLPIADDLEDAKGNLVGEIMKAMEDYIEEDSDSDQAADQVAEKVNLVADKAAALAQDLRRDVTVAELSQETGLSEDEILEAARFSANQIEGLIVPEVK